MLISDWSSDVCSSDLPPQQCRRRVGLAAISRCRCGAHSLDYRRQHHLARRGDANRGAGDEEARRSEEHTSELQSLMRISYAVFCLKKKTNTTNNKQTLDDISKCIDYNLHRDPTSN